MILCLVNYKTIHTFLLKEYHGLVNQINQKLIIQTPKIITETYGIPRDGGYYTTDKSRAFYKLPFCHERKQNIDEVDYNDVEEFYKKMKELDMYFASTEFKKKIFGNKI